MKEHILAFGCETIAPLLTQTFAPRKMAVKAVPLADYAQTVGALAARRIACARRRSMPGCRWASRCSCSAASTVTA